MRTCLSGQDFSIQVQVMDDYGASVLSGAATYTVTGPSGVVQTGAGEIFNGVLSIQILAANNIISGFEEEARVIFITAGSVSSFEEFIVQPAALPALAVPAQSALTLHEALLLAHSTEGLEGWPSTPMRQRMSALKAAWVVLSNYRFVPFEYGSDTSTAATDRLVTGDFRIDELTEEEWLSTPQRFRRALGRAQLVQASVIIDGDAAADLRASGILTETVGESSRTFNTVGPAKTSLHARALRELRGYIDRSIRMARA